MYDFILIGFLLVAGECGWFQTDDPMHSYRIYGIFLSSLTRLKFKEFEKEKLSWPLLIEPVCCPQVHLRLLFR